MKKKGILTRTEIEQLRAQTFERVEREELLLKDAALILELSYSQAKRLFSRFKTDGLQGLAHGLRGTRSNHAFDQQIRDAVIKLYQQRYPDFGPTLACEKLDQLGYKLDHETLRLWLIEEGLWASHRKRSVHRSWRERGRVIASRSFRRACADGRFIPSLV